MTVAVEIAIKFDIFCNLNYQDIPTYNNNIRRVFQYDVVEKLVGCSLTLIKKIK